MRRGARAWTPLKQPSSLGVRPFGKKDELAFCARDVDTLRASMRRDIEAAGRLQRLEQRRVRV